MKPGKRVARDSACRPARFITDFGVVLVIVKRDPAISTSPYRPAKSPPRHLHQELVAALDTRLAHHCPAQRLETTPHQGCSDFAGSEAARLLNRRQVRERMLRRSRRASSS